MGKGRKETKQPGTPAHWHQATRNTGALGQIQKLPGTPVHLVREQPGIPAQKNLIIQERRKINKQTRKGIMRWFQSSGGFTHKDSINQKAQQKAQQERSTCVRLNKRHSNSSGRAEVHQVRKAVRRLVRKVSTAAVVPYVQCTWPEIRISTCEYRSSRSISTEEGARLSVRQLTSQYAKAN